MTNETIRNIIREHAKACGQSYRITSTGEVHYYGLMPNTSTKGWYLMAHSAKAFAAEINNDAAIEASDRLMNPAG